MRSKSRWIATSMVLGGALLTAGQAQAAHDDVQWSVHAATPGVVVQAPQAHAGPHRHGHEPRQFRDARDVRHGAVAYVQPTRWDRDGDGIPNHRDRHHNPRWDVDGDGVPNRRDNAYTPPWDVDGDGRPNWQDRHDDRGHRHGR